MQMSGTHQGAKKTLKNPIRATRTRMLVPDRENIDILKRAEVDREHDKDVLRRAGGTRCNAPDDADGTLSQFRRSDRLVDGEGKRPGHFCARVAATRAHSGDWSAADYGFDRGARREYFRDDGRRHSLRGERKVVHEAHQCAKLFVLLAQRFVAAGTLFELREFFGERAILRFEGCPCGEYTAAGNARAYTSRPL